MQAIEDLYYFLHIFWKGLVSSRNNIFLSTYLPVTSQLKNYIKNQYYISLKKIDKETLLQLTKKILLKVAYILKIYRHSHPPHVEVSPLVLFKSTLAMSLALVPKNFFYSGYIQILFSFLNYFSHKNINLSLIGKKKFTLFNQTYKAKVLF